MLFWIVNNLVCGEMKKLPQKIKHSKMGVLLNCCDF